MSLKLTVLADIINRYKNEERIESIRLPGRPRKLKEGENVVMIYQVKKLPKISASKIASDVSKRF